MKQFIEWIRNTRKVKLYIFAVILILILFGFDREAIEEAIMAAAALTATLIAAIGYEDGQEKASRKDATEGAGQISDDPGY